MKKLTCAVMGALMITSVLAGCGKKENTTTAGNEGNSQVSQMQESSSKSEEKSTSQSDDQLESQISIFSGFTAQIPKGYTCTGTAGSIIFNSKDKTDLYISGIFDGKSTLPLTSVTGEQIEKSVSQLLWSDNGYTKDVPVKVASVTDVDINGIKMKKFEGKLTLAKSSSDKDTTWDCYIYGYVLEAGPETVGFFGLEQEQSQPADKIELIKKNMDAMVKTIKLI